MGNADDSHVRADLASGSLGLAADCVRDDLR